MKARAILVLSLLLVSANLFWSGINTMREINLHKAARNVKQERLDEFNAAVMCAASATMQEMVRKAASHPSGPVRITLDDQAWILRRTLELRKEHFPDLPQIDAKIQLEKPASKPIPKGVL